MIQSIIKKRMQTIAKRRGLFILRMVIPAIAVIPLMALPTNVFFVASVITILTLIFGIFGVGQALGEDRAKGALQTIAVAPIRPVYVVWGEIIANTLIMTVQFLPLLAGIWLLSPSGAGEAIGAHSFAFLSTALFASTVGVLLVPFVAEMRTLLFASSMFAILTASGVLVPLRSATQLAIAKWIPATYLYQGTMLLFGKESIVSTGEILLLSIFPTLVILAGVELISKRIIR
ncbi:MAG: ABC-2 type transporter [Candidatus Wolfebacteria bacterium GW2011_GWC2_46_275]|uniref:ABC-2 type transporter n=2 Tax=Candidatus Wolfeibacteriota TaxID=1752735 RepID=A0A0G1WF00_9BACT|nr:MAG: ABC-2 type transporter [Candidatus Wolfebacteria bacterium GW2011_GWC2_46_275]KKU42020.1 MAG: ABC-2 type transporter [Candidatus Wolfebacteria bacterium GW2011_GWB2_46_69]KKU54444.1 MAG: ABC-2 type transporter [Candidatus Wolfebacteria bacterium GW2011_GWC1_47_103]KKU59771.1 MAG: ABC-2 type transporter [Candidatus Wolfebacteria bacterium GW2011_GWE2_47_12]KKU70649.1 MAG: ABC-2 type transporter [Candidatus Wolfebacteria bacterium GW2011_GWB1_47_243]KKU76400.1 MAG: ABC-2 type transporter